MAKKEDMHLGEIVLKELDKKHQILDDDHMQYHPGVIAAFQKEFKKARESSTYDKINLLAKYMSKYEKAMYKEGEIDGIEANERHLSKYRGVLEQLSRNMGISIDEFVDRAVKNDQQVIGMLDNWKQRYVVDQLKDGAKADILFKYRDDKVKISDYLANIVGEKEKVFIHRYEESGIEDALKKYRSSVKK